MKKFLIVLILLMSLSCSGCALILVGVAASLTATIVRKVASNPRSLTEEERKKTEYQKIEGNDSEILDATRKVLIARGYTIQNVKTNETEEGPAVNFTYGNQAEPSTEKKEKETIVTGIIEDPLLRITAVIEDSTEDYVGLRLIAENENGLVENKRLYNQIFEDIQDLLEKGE